MENLIELAGPAEVRGRAPRSRALALIAALALVVGGLVLARQAASPAPSTKIVSNVDNRSTPVDGVGGVLGRSLGFGAAQAQISVGALLCPTLNALVASVPFLAALLQPLRVAYGCTSN